MKIAFVADPIEQLKVAYDSTIAMMAAAAKRQWEVYFILQQDLFVQDCQPFAQARKVAVSLAHDPWYQLDEIKTLPLAECDLILMRKDPPFNMDYIMATYILELAEQQGVVVCNRPQSLRDFNEKMCIQWFPQCIPPTLVSSQHAPIKAFYQQHGDVIVKPLDSAGGASIFRIRADDPNFNVIVEVMTQKGQRLVMVQQYLPAVQQGDKRVLLINGKPIPYGLTRVAAAGETRANASVGASTYGSELTARDRWLCEQIGETLRQKGLYFVGIDIIGDYITEINVTSPSFIPELNDAFQLDIAGDLLQCLTGISRKSAINSPTA